MSSITSVSPTPNKLTADSKKGETPAQMAHVAEILATATDTSIDGPWVTKESMAVVDCYVLSVMIIFMVPKMILLYIPLLFLLIPATLLNSIYYKSNCKENTQVFNPPNSTWYIHLLLQFVLTIPASVLIISNLFLDKAIFFVFGVIYATLTCGWGQVMRNMKVIAPYRRGPSLYWHFGDIVTACGGMSYRQGYFEFLRGFTLMFFLNPWIKYWLTGNLWCSDLGERYITQIGQSMGDLDIDDVEKYFKKCISDATLSTKNQNKIDQMFFCPHYPYPKPGSGMSYAIGMQHAAAVTTLVHTTHFKSSDSTDNNVQGLSTSSERNVYRVMLWRNNPFHIFTGFVEAGISNGKPSQPEKNMAAEHPMWLINGHNYLAASRSLKFSTGWVDIFFDKFIPHFQRFIRGNATDWDNANKLFELDPRVGYETQIQSSGDNADDCVGV